MKNQLLVLSILLLSLQGFAADLFVRENGAGGAYTTISAAITAAADGDRIVIKPNAGDIPYFENLVVDKSLTLISEDTNLRYVLQGTIEIVPAINMTVSIHNISLINNTSQTGILASQDVPTGGRCVVNVINSSVSKDISLARANITSNIISCSNILNVNISHGKVIGSSLGVLNVSDLDNAPLASEDIYIIANTIGNINTPISNGGKLNLRTTKYGFRIYNNEINSSATGSTDGNIRFFDVKENSINEIRNNNFFTQSNGVYISSILSTASIEIVNNSFDINSGTDQIIWDRSNQIISKAFFNINDYRNAESNYLDVDALASNSYAPTLATGVVDAGHSDLIYNDIDLTRNDVGVNGGSYAWDNYYPANADGKPQVYFLQLPNRVTTGTTIDVKAEAFSK